MRKNKFLAIFIVLAVMGALIFIVSTHKNKENGEVTREIHPAPGKIRTFISTTGTVLPKNRLEVKPPVNGRVESILVREGDRVKPGEVLAWMSSTERAALLDAARGKGDAVLKYWQEVYKPIPLISPIEGEVIVATTQPAQTVTTSDAVVVLSDHLIVRAQVDETDIGKVSLDQKAVVTLDAYPDTKIKARVEHIYYESQTVNNVTIYPVDLFPEEVPPFFRSGMNASVDFIQQDKANILLLPLEAVYKENGQSFCLVKQENAKEPLKVALKLGISDDKNVEVISGVTEKDRVIVKSKKYTLPKDTGGTNPFSPFRRR